LRLRLAVLIALGVPLQGVIGGFTVLSDLNPWVVGLHLVLSIIMVALAAWLVFDLTASYGASDNTTSRLSIAAYVVLAASISVGAVVTGAGPHAGDAEALRNGRDPETWSRLHALSMWLFAASMVFFVWRLRVHPARNRG